MVLPDTQDVFEGIATAEREERERAEALATPAAVKEREDSRRGFSASDSPASAAALLEGAFAEQLKVLDNDPARFLSDAKLVQALGPTAATVKSEGNGQLMDGGGMPLRTENDDGELSKVDLSLRPVEGGFETVNALVDLKVGDTASKPVRIGEDMSIAQVGVPGEGAVARRIGDDSIFFADVGGEGEMADTDLLVAPISSGVELFSQLRSVESPETLRFRIGVPDGANLRADGFGGAEVTKGEELVAYIPPPYAVDAQGGAVDVEMTVQGDELVLHVAHRDEDVAYPLLVDPAIFDDWVNPGMRWIDGAGLSALTDGTWQYSESGSWILESTYCIYQCWGGSGRGLFVSMPSGTQWEQQYGHWAYSAPNANSYLVNAWANPFVRGDHNCSRFQYPQPHDYVGMWAAGKWNRVLGNQAIEVGSVDIQSWGEAFVLGIATGGGNTSNWMPCWRDVYVGGAVVWLDDLQYPYLDYLGPTPEGWAKKDGAPRTFAVSASDAGLGVQTVRMFGVGTQQWLWDQPWCAGTRSRPCPNSRGGQISFTTDGFPYEGRYNGEGKERKFTVQVIDPTDKRWQLERPLWLDGTPPVVSLEGQLATATKQEGKTEKPQAEGDDELSLPTYKLHISADDGADRSGVKEIKVFLDDKSTPEEVKSVTCGYYGCGQILAMDYTLRLPGLEAGEHTLRIVAVDKVGNESDADRKIKFEYAPATGMKEEFVLQRFRLPDGNDYSGEADYHGPEIAVNVMNGNVVFHQRDVDVTTDRAGLELERVYNSQLPEENDGQWGHGWQISQAPEFEPEEEAPAETATMTEKGEITSSVPVPKTVGQEAFSARLKATVAKTADGYEVEPADADEIEVFDESGRIEEVVLGDDEPVYLAPRTEEELELMGSGPPSLLGPFGSSGSESGEFSHPAGVAVDAEGRVWVVDQDNDRVQRFTADGEYLGSFGSSGSGNGQFGRPTDVAIDAQGNLWVTDAGNSRVEKFNASGEYLAQFGAYGTGDGQLKNAESIAIAPNGTIWVGDTYNGRLQKFNASGEFLQVVGSKGSGQGQMIEPTGIDVGPGGNVWVADWGNQRVSVFSASGEFVRQFGSAGSGEGQFARPDVIEVDTRGNVWVGDQNNDRIQRFDQDGEYVDQFGGTGSGEGEFNFGWPMGIGSDSKGNLWISDTGNHRVQRWKTPGYVPSYEETIGSLGGGDGQFNHPADVAVDAEGNLWVADKFNNRVQRFDSDGQFLGKFGSAGSAAGQLGGPSSIAFDAEGDFWVAERSNNRIQKFNPAGESLATVGSGGSGNGKFSGPEGIAIDAEGDIWVSDTYNHRIQRFDSSGEFLEVVNPTGLGAIEPTGIDAGPEGNVWVTDWAHNRVVAISEAGTLIHSFGSSGTGDGQFARPDAVDVDAAGNAWVGDQNNGRVQLFNAAGEYVAQFGGKGSGEGQFSFGYPFGIAADGHGSIWVTDSNNDRLQRWSSESAPAVEGEEAVLAPYFDPPAVDYEYSEGMLEELGIEDEATEGEDPSLDLQLEDDLVAEVESAEAGDTSYDYDGDELTAVDGPEGETEYGHDAEGRLTSIELPNGTIATITYDGTSRATAVKVDPAGLEGAKTTNFFYKAEPRQTKVWGGGNPEITYDIGDDGSVLRWAYEQSPPSIVSRSGSIWTEKGKELENKDRTLFITGYSPHQVASIKVVVNGNSVVEEKTCEDPAVPPSHVCDQPDPLEWIMHPSEFAPGRLDVEVIVEDFNEHKFAERLFVIIPQQPPADPTVAERPNFKAIKLFREEYGLDRENPLTEPQMNELVLELLYEWEGRDPTVMRAVEEWGMPMRAPELAEMEWRREYTNRAAEVIPQWAEEHAPTTYGGMYVDDPAGGVIHVGFKGSPEAQLALVEALKQAPDLLAPGQIQAFPVPPPNALPDLRALVPSISAALATSPPISDLVTSVHIPPEGNVVQVRAANPATVESFLVSHLGASAPIAIEPGHPFMDFASRYARSGPVVAGSVLINAGARECTAGFGSRAPAGASQGRPQYKYFVLTAGHCYAKKEVVGRAVSLGKGVAIGKVRRSGVDAQPPVDAAGVGIAADLRSHSVLNGKGSLRVEPVQGHQPTSEGRTVCWSGKTSGNDCGRVLFFAEVDDDRLVYVAKGLTISGDSGGPVWDPKTHRAIGLISGSSEDFATCWDLPDGKKACNRMGFTPLRFKGSVPGVEATLGVEVLKQG